MTNLRSGIPGVVIVRGTGDVGSAVAARLFRAGSRVVLHDEPQPSALRRGMAFTDAVFDGEAALDGLMARHVEGVHELTMAIAGRRFIPVMVMPLARVLEAYPCAALVDARMRKHARPEHQKGMAPLTIGLGPNFVAGDMVDVAIETSWGDRLGAVITAGSTLPLQGEPRDLGGVGRARFVYAPIAGPFTTAARIGNSVEEGAVVADIEGTPLRAPIGGVLRGLTRSGVSVATGTKVIEVDPRGDPAAAFGLGERPLRIAAGVARALSSHLILV